MTCWKKKKFICLCLQEVKRAIISDLTKLGKEAGLKSFEQVMTHPLLQK